MPFPPKDTAPRSCYLTLDRIKLLILPGNIFSKICFSQHQKGVEKTMIYFIKIQSEDMQMTWDISFLVFVGFVIFWNVMALQFCKWYLPCSMVLTLLVLLCNHGNLIIKLHQKKNGYCDEGWLFIGSFKIGSVPGILNKEVLTQFTY